MKIQNNNDLIEKGSLGRSTIQRFQIRQTLNRSLLGVLSTKESLERSCALKDENSWKIALLKLSLYKKNFLQKIIMM